MPSNQNPLGALPARFRRQRLLIVGCGDVGQRVARDLQGRLRVLALTTSADRVGALRALGVTPLSGDLDRAASLARLAGLATRVLHLAPPPGEGQVDLRSLALARALRRRVLPRALVYVSTSGVYGDCAGDWVAESRPVAPATARALRRVNAERALRHLGRAGLSMSILRVPGIYAADREGGTPEARLRRGTPVLAAQDDVYTNHIHADDLARAVVRALWRGMPQRITNVADDSAMPMGDYFDLAADLWRLPHPARISLAEAEQQLSPTLLSFMRESRRLSNTRMRQELGLVLRYQTVHHGLQAAVYLVGPGTATDPGT